MIVFAAADVYRLLSVVVNSIYSFCWDVAKDWDLTLLSRPNVRNDPEHPYGLRQHRFFRSNAIYYVAILVDFLLRCTWSLKLSPHLGRFNDLESGIFVMEILEIARRWLWIFLRVEAEWSRYRPSTFGRKKVADLRRSTQQSWTGT